MVFFTCNHCGSSLKKNKVDKHYAIECLANPSLSCMDCLKDFYGEEYKGHTKCMTEDQKYSGKPTNANPALGKGEKKQLMWVETVRKIVETKGSALTFQERQLFECMKDFENIPRKKKKFENFLKNVMKRYIDQRTIDNVWSLLEEHKPKAGDSKEADDLAKELKEIVPSEGRLVEERRPKGKGSSKISEENFEGKMGLNENDDEENNIYTEQNERSLKKERKENGDYRSGNVSVKDDSYQKETVKKEKKKHKKTDTEKVTIAMSKNAEEDELVMEMGKEESPKLSKKEKKERRKREKYEAQLKSLEGSKSEDNMDVDSCEVQDISAGSERQRKKNREKMENGSAVQDVGDNGVSKEKDGRKRRKREADVKADIDADKRLKEENEVQMEGAGSNSLGEKDVNVSACDDHDKPKGKFKWDRIILNILQSVPDNELPIKRLRKKVLAEYQQSLMAGGAYANSLAEALGMFERKLHKVPGVKILKDRAKIVKCSE